MTRQMRKQFPGEYFRAQEGEHQVLECALPFPSMGFDVPAKTLECQEMGNFMDQSDQEPVGIAHGVDGDLVGPVGKGPVITVPGDPFIYDTQVHPIGPDKFRAGNHRPFGKIAFKDIAHMNKGSKLLMRSAAGRIGSEGRTGFEKTYLAKKFPVKYTRLILIFPLLFLSACSRDALDPLDQKSLYGSWKLLEVLLDPGDGSGQYVPSDTGERLILERDGSYLSNWEPCNPGAGVGDIFSGTYTIPEPGSLEISCDSPQPGSVKGSLQNGFLILSYGCTEPCLYKFLKTTDL